MLALQRPTGINVIQKQKILERYINQHPFIIKSANWEVSVKCASIDGADGWGRRPINAEDTCEGIE